ncbi:UNVERIFIED_CONTAM: Protein-tyrosine-phosphatase PTP1 [Sesamum calycinum]|uniref:Protein-tyrosine-phosphatase PTP1 n=1 Tax=Sesamum calycinum TaxID=2727403 RepID=A0AAW2K230_9LAMI
MRASDMINRCTVALDSLNYSKNRYTDVLPFDDNRVILKRCTDYRSSARGYINASFVTTSESVSRFIATQGQLSHTSEDFWEMIIQYHCPVIVMLTRLVDNYRANRMRASDMINRCTVALDSLNYSKNRYTDVLPFDDNRVILKRCTDYRSSARGTSESVSRFIATQGQLSHTSEDFWEMIIQYHCPVIVMLTRLVDNYRANRMRASVMINRCTVALDSLNYSKNRYTDVLPFDDNRVILKRCTYYRSSARGTSESVSRFIATQGQLSHTSEDVWEMIIQYHCPLIVMLTRLVDNYRANRLRASDMINRCTVTLDSLNYSKNRYTDVLPFDDNRVILKGCTDYRSSARGTSESVSRFIAAQGQLSHTSEDFWEMIIQYHCPVIVMLTRLVDNTVFKPILPVANRMRASDMINRCTVALDSLNYSKKRYTDVLPFDDNRVILKRCTDYRSSARGYINASFVTTSESVSRFIATQGPLSHTSEDFWEMIIQYHCPVIVMLTRLVDNYREQCLFCYDATIDELDPYFADYM